MGSITRKIRNNGLDLIFRQTHKEFRGYDIKRSQKKRILTLSLAYIEAMQEGLMFLHKKKRIYYDPYDNLGDY